MENNLHIPVRGLVEFLLREGDLDDSADASPESALLEGARMHREIQKRSGAGYASEVPLKQIYLLDGEGDLVELTLEGRADGVFEAVIPDSTGMDGNVLFIPGDDPGIEERDHSYTWIDEIKTTYHSLDSLDEPVPVHLAQAKCYAGMYAQQNGLNTIGVRMTYCHLESHEMRFFYRLYNSGELFSFIRELLKEYEKWIRFRIDWIDKRDDSIRKMVFPFDYRPGQKELASNVYRTIIRRRKLFLEAPTGTGKTISVLFPSVKALGEGEAQRIFYLTAKTIAANAPRDAAALMREKQGLKLKEISLTAKEKICILEKPACNPATCPRAKGHFDRVNDALFDIVNGCDCFDRETIAWYAEKYQICPFDFALDISMYCDLVIGDYNYVFDPHVSLKRFFARGTAGDDLFLIDEAHNLVERGRKMYSAQIGRDELMQLKKSVKGIFPQLEKQLNACSRAFLALKKINGEACVVLGSAEEAEKIISSLARLQTVIADLLENERKRKLRKKRKAKDSDAYLEERDDLRKEILNFYFSLSHFMLIYESLDDHYRIYSEQLKDSGFTVRLMCMDPSARLKEKMDLARASVLFSATFLPIRYYKSLLGGTDDDYEVYAESVFDPQRQKILILSDVTSRYRMRGYEEYRKIAKGVDRIISGRHGNYLVFFPSYAFLNETADIFESQFCTDDVSCIRQQPSMKEEEREAFLSGFRDIHEAESSVVGFCVLGGIFSEGIDLVSDRLIGVMIVGTGIPQVCSERELLKAYFDEAGSSGYDYAYRYPGMNKVMQAAGRVIRTADDIGIVALFDERFCASSYQRLFPREWKEWEMTTTDAAGGRVERFWNEWL
ncbi:MAG: ATP-dependent DNA helicase [Lachnospiraceae bacterium]|nr:ATP-dependent DNA helicase [Lachnospiraceae bacterium]